MKNLIFLRKCIIGITELNANSVDPDQTLRSAVSDLDLHCLPMLILWDDMHKGVKRSLIAVRIYTHSKRPVHNIPASTDTSSNH